MAFKQKKILLEMFGQLSRLRMRQPAQLSKFGASIRYTNNLKRLTYTILICIFTSVEGKISNRIFFLQDIFYRI